MSLRTYWTLIALICTAMAVPVAVVLWKALG